MKGKHYRTLIHIACDDDECKYCIEESSDPQDIANALLSFVLAETLDYDIQREHYNVFVNVFVNILKRMDYDDAIDVLAEISEALESNDNNTDYDC